MEELTIVIPIGDWEEEYLEAELDVSSEEEILKRVRNLRTPAQLARWVLVARERGDAPEDILPPNKLVIHQGAAANISGLVKSKRTTVKLKNGRKVKIRTFVGTVKDEELTIVTVGTTPAKAKKPKKKVVADDTAFVGSLTSKALPRALAYMRKRVPGYIRGRLEIIAANGGDVQAAVDELNVIVEEMVEELT